jgi:hypothetical protein
VCFSGGDGGTSNQGFAASGPEAVGLKGLTSIENLNLVIAS